MTARTDLSKILFEAVIAALLAAILFTHMIGLKLVDELGVLTIHTQWDKLAMIVGAVFVGRILIMLLRDMARGKAKTDKPAPPRKIYTYILWGLMAAAIILPLTPLSNRYVLDVSTLIFTYMILATGLSLVVGMAGLLDLGFVAFYAIGAYAFGLLSLHTGLGFWTALPLAILAAGLIASLLGLVVLRLRGDYLAIVTLGFAEILRIVIINWSSFTQGANGISGIPRPDFFGMTFTGEARVMVLYYIGIAFYVITALFASRIKKLPIGRAFEAVREDELAARSMGINTTAAKLSAYVLAACCGALAGAFFAAKQGFISPESFTFTESALVLAIVVLAGMGHPLGILLSAVFLVGLPEIFRDVQDFRMVAFGAGMVLIMIWRPEGLFAQRPPALTLPLEKR